MRSPDDLFATPRGGALPEYDHLKTCYSGSGANYNTTTRLRRYVGEAGLRPLLVGIVCDGAVVRWRNNGRLVFDYVDPEPYTGGHFAFRTVWSHFRIEGFRVWRV